MERWIALDAVKGVGLIAMTLTHSLSWYFVYPQLRLSSEATGWFDVAFIAGGVFIMGLVFAAGSSVRLSWQSYIDTHTGRVSDAANQLARKVLLRSLQLWLVGTLINILVWGWYAAWYWNVLHFIALAQIVLYLAARFGGTFLIGLLALGSGLASFWYQELQTLGSYGLLGEVFIGDITSPHIWPLLPWLCVPALGYLVGHYQHLLTAPTLRRPVTVAGVVLVGGAVLAGLFAIPIGYTFEYIWDYATQPPLVFLIAATGVYLLLLRTLAGISSNGRWLTWLPLLGRHITFLYVVHLLVGFWFFADLLAAVQQPIIFFWLGVGVQFFCYGLVVAIYFRYRNGTWWRTSAR